MRKRLVVGNWKMYIESPEAAKAFALSLRRKTRDMKGVEVGIAPPLSFVAGIAHALVSSPVKVGAQTLSPHAGGAHTGDVSAAMLKAIGASFVIMGHSERRAVPPDGMGEGSEVVRAQLERAIDAGLMPVLCIGEREREVGGEHFTFIESQLTTALKDMPKNLLKKLVIAYEPVWAIGKSGEFAMRPADVQEMVIFIRKVLADILDRQTALKVPILYGAAVEPQNAAALIAEGGVSGLLVGHASTTLEDFLAILNVCKS